MLLALSIILGVLSIANKALLFLERRSGWTSGMAIGAISAFYFYEIGLRILAAAELGFFVVMLYGYVRSIQPTRRSRLYVSVLISALSILLAYVLFVGQITIIEAVSSLGFIWGGYQLTTRNRALGWLLFMIAHITTFMAAFAAQQSVFASLQIVSALVCLYALGDALFRPKPPAGEPA